MRTQTFNIALPKTLVKKIDRVAKEEYRNRSELIREAVWVYLKDKEEWEELLKYGKKQGKKIIAEREGDVDKIVYELRHGRKLR